MRGVISYLVERFQPGMAIILATATAALLVGCASIELALALPTRFSITLIVSVGFLAFLLRTRVTDDFKDQEHDDANYPNRPVQRGAINKVQLMRLGVGALVVELFCVALASAASHSLVASIWYLPVLAFSYLTSKEFFMGKVLAKHFSVYFALHQLIFVWFGLWVLELVPRTTWSWPAVASLFAMVLLMATIEIIRKFEVRKNPSGQVVKDTYVAVWGLSGTVMVLALFLCTVAALFYLSTKSLVPFAVSLPTALAVTLGRSNPKLVQAAVFSNFLILAGWVWGI